MVNITGRMSKIAALVLFIPSHIAQREIKYAATPSPIIILVRINKNDGEWASNKPKAKSIAAIIIFCLFPIPRLINLAMVDFEKPDLFGGRGFEGV